MCAHRAPSNWPTRIWKIHLQTKLNAKNILSRSWFSQSSGAFLWEFLHEWDYLSITSASMWLFCELCEAAGEDSWGSLKKIPISALKSLLFLLCKINWTNLLYLLWNCNPQHKLRCKTIILGGKGKKMHNNLVNTWLKLLFITALIFLCTGQSLWASWLTLSFFLVCPTDAGLDLDMDWLGRSRNLILFWWNHSFDFEVFFRWFSYWKLKFILILN